MRLGMFFQAALHVFVMATLVMGPKGEARAAERKAKKPRKLVTICVDELESFPLSFMQDGKLRGIYADLAREPLEALGYEVRFKRLPWRRCVEHEVRKGESDAALSAAWNPEREKYLWFPRRAGEDGPRCRSPFALICNGPVLLVPASSPYRYEGEVSTIPQPVRIPRGYAQVGEYRQKGLRVDEGPEDALNLRKMLRDGRGSVLMWQAVARSLAKHEEFRGRFRQVEGFADLSDGFLAFSPNGHVSRDEAERIWAEMARRRGDPDYETRIAARYDSNPATAGHAEKMPVRASESGRLVLCGGALDLSPKNKEVFDTVMDLARRGDATGQKPRIAVLSNGSYSSWTAWENWRGSVGDPGYGKAFANLGFEPAFVPLALDNYAGRSYLASTREAKVADDEKWAAVVRAADVVFLGGGDQIRHYRTLKRDDGSDSKILTAMRDVLARGGIIMGTSAGTHAQGELLFGGGTSYHYLAQNRVRRMYPKDQLGPVRYERRRSELTKGVEIDKQGFLVDVKTREREPVSPTLSVPGDPEERLGSYGKGLAFLPGVLLDSHFAARGRLGRLLVTLSKIRASKVKGANLGIGVDENTCLVFDVGSKTAKVVGEHGAWIVSLEDARLGSLTKPFQIENARLTYLTSGDFLNLLEDGSLGSVTSTKKKVTIDPSKTGADAGDVFAPWKISRILEEMVEGGLGAMNTLAPPPRELTEEKGNPGGRALPVHRLRFKAGPRTVFYGTGKDITVDRLLLHVDQAVIADQKP